MKKKFTPSIGIILAGSFAILFYLLFRHLNFSGSFATVPSVILSIVLTKVIEIIYKKTQK